MIRRPPRSTRTDTLVPTRRSSDLVTQMRAGRAQPLGFVEPDDPRLHHDAAVAPRPNHSIAVPMSLSPRPERFTAIEIGRAHVELQSLMRISYAVFCLKKNNNKKPPPHSTTASEQSNHTTKH